MRLRPILLSHNIRSACSVTRLWLHTTTPILNRILQPHGHHYACAMVYVCDQHFDNLKFEIGIYSFGSDRHDMLCYFCWHNLQSGTLITEPALRSGYRSQLVSFRYNWVYNGINVSSQVILLLVNTWALVFTTAGCLKALMWVSNFVTYGEHLDSSVHYSRMFNSTNVSSQFCYFWWTLGH